MSLEYNSIDVGDRFKLSPSGFSMFFGNPHKWYKDHVLKKSSFKGNTNTVVGTIIHDRIEKYFDDIPIDKEAEQQYVEFHSDVVEVDAWKVDEDVERLWNLLILELPTWDRPDKQEQTTRLDIPNSKLTIAGTYDYLRGTVLGDYKTSSSAPKKIKVSHKIQLALYTLAERYKGTKLTHWEVRYIVKTKTPKTVTHLIEIDEDFVEEIKQEVKNMDTRLSLLTDNPELVDVLFFENRDSFF